MKLLNSQDVSTVSNGIALTPVQDLSFIVRAHETLTVDGLIVFQSDPTRGIKIAVSANKDVSYNAIKFNSDPAIKSFTKSNAFGVEEPAVWASPQILEGENGLTIKGVIRGGVEDAIVSISFAIWNVGNTPTTIKRGSFLNIQ